MQTQIDLHRYTVVQPGKAVRQFDTGEAAIKYLVDHPGHAKLYAPDGNLLMTKGMPPADDGAR
jgi:hypothetical protein